MCTENKRFVLLTISVQTLYVCMCRVCVCVERELGRNENIKEKVSFLIQMPPPTLPAVSGQPENKHYRCSCSKGKNGRLQKPLFHSNSEAYSSTCCLYLY